MYGLMADLHLHPWSAFASVDALGVNSRLRGLVDEIKRACKELREEGGTYMLLAGDVFHVRGSVSPVVLNLMNDTLAECHEHYGTQFIVIPGNHDLAGRDSERLGSAVTSLETPFVRVTAGTLEVPDIAALMVPWHESVEALKAEIIRARDDLATSTSTGDVSEWDLILHAPIDGVIEGLPAHGLDPAWLGATGFRRVFSGHYHNHKVFPASPALPTEVISIGALAHHTWSDVSSRAGFLLVDDKVNFRRSHLPAFVDLTTLANHDPEEIPLLVDKNYVRVRVAADKTKEVEAARKELLDMGALAVLVQAEPKAAAARPGAAVVTVAAGASLEQSVGDFIKTLTCPEPEKVSAAAMDVLASTETLGD